MSRTIYHIEVRHEALGKYRDIRGYDANVVQQKAQAQNYQWEEMWARKQEADAKREGRERASRERESKKSLAESRTREAQEAIEQLRGILSHALEQNAALNWETLKIKDAFPESKPKEPRQRPIPPYPKETDPKYKPKFGILDVFFSANKQKKIDGAAELFKSDYRKWQSEQARISASNAKDHQNYMNALAAWEADAAKWSVKKEQHNREVDERKRKYRQKDPDNIIDWIMPLAPQMLLWKWKGMR